MALTLAQVTSFDRIRSALGVTPRDVTDTQITNLALDESLELELMSWLPAYENVISDGQAPTPTEGQRKAKLLLGKFATYFCAAEIAAGSPNVFVKEISDGNVLIRRNDSDFERLLQRMQGMAASAKIALAGELGIPLGVSEFSSLVARVSPAYDPVLGE